MVRLNKFLADAGLGSRRRCDELIRRGRVALDGRVVTELGVKVEPEQTVTIDGKPLQQQRLVYWLVNKPPGYLCTNFDPGGKPKAVDLLPHVPERVYTVGRLDEASEGLLLLTNDGQLALRLTHPSYGIRKTYHVLVAGLVTDEELQRMARGVRLSEGTARAVRVHKLGTRGNATLLEIVLAEGKNREIRRMLAKLGHKVMELRRVAIGPIKLDRLKRGKCRKLQQDEIALLRRITNAEKQSTHIDRKPPAAFQRNDGASRREDHE
jgi:23S rRNA pseudouridine2605 synthase